MSDSRQTSAARPGPAARVLLRLIAAYRTWLSPLLGAHCRFAPSCSAYGAQAVTRHGALRGGWLTARRVARCHPFHPGGHDPVPEARRPTVSAATPAISATCTAATTSDPRPSRAVPARPDAPEQTRA